MSLPDGIAADADSGGSAGRPPRPTKAMRVLLFFIYFFGFGIAVPGAIVALVQAKYGLIDGPSTGSWSTEDGRFTNGRTVLGTTDPVIDMRTMFPFAQAAALTSDRNGMVAMAIATASAEETKRAVEMIERQYQIKIPDSPNSLISRESFWRGQVRRDDTHLLIVLGRDQAAVEQRIATMATLPTQKERATEAFGEQIKSITKYGIFLWAAMQFYFFGRIASWAGGEPAFAGVPPATKEMLMSRLLALNQQDIPFAISRGNRDNELVIDWRYADAKWADLMRLRGLRGAYRLVLRLDEGAHNARAQDRYASFEWSAGRGPNLAVLKWRASAGITFYEYKYERVFGVQFKNGKLTFDHSYVYTFNLNELKQPIIDIIRNAGWNFRPVITFFRPIGG